MELWAGCVSGALSDGMHEKLVAGFEQVSVEPWRTYENAAPGAEVAFASALSAA
jgi:hypothetical protein